MHFHAPNRGSVLDADAGKVATTGFLAKQSRDGSPRDDSSGAKAIARDVSPLTIAFAAKQAFGSGEEDGSTLSQARAKGPTGAHGLGGG
jgi:hypothetical protein